jgi:hypothetical protein
MKDYEDVGQYTTFPVEGGGRGFIAILFEGRITINDQGPFVGTKSAEEAAKTVIDVLLENINY